MNEFCRYVDALCNMWRWSELVEIDMYSRYISSEKLYIKAEIPS